MGGDYLDDLEALREDIAIQRAIGRKEIPDPTTTGDFCRRFTLGQVCRIGGPEGDPRGHQIRLKVSVLHRWWRDLVYAWKRVGSLEAAAQGG